jgi:ribonuclease BN (tRNA processing enzyme)
MASISTLARVRLRVLGGCGAWPAAGQACSGYLVEHDGFRLLLDPGYAILPRLLEVIGAELIDAVLVSHGHPDHCADLHPLLRARALRDDPPAPLPVYTLPDAIDRVLALDRPGMLEDAFTLHEFAAGEGFGVGPFQVETWLLPHFVPNAGIRLTAGGRTLAYTGDSGPSPDLADLARAADLFLAEATFPEEVPVGSARYLSSARQAGELAARAAVGHLMLTHLWPDSDPSAAEKAARRAYEGSITVARAGTIVDLDLAPGLNKVT